MSNRPTILPDLHEVAKHLRNELENRNFILVYAYNGIGKTRLSTAFKDIGKETDEFGETTKQDTLYFNAFTEDLFIWNNDLENDRERSLRESVLKNDMLSYFAVKARSKGGILLLAFQDIEGLRKVAGREGANELIAQCSHKALLRMQSVESARWASELLGQYETIEYFRSYGEKASSDVKSTNEQRVLKDAVLPSEIYAIRSPSQDAGLQGYFVSPGRCPYGTVISGSQFTGLLGGEAEIAFIGRVEKRTTEDQELSGWTESKRMQLNLDAARNCFADTAAVKLSDTIPQHRNVSMTDKTC